MPRTKQPFPKCKACKFRRQESCPGWQNCYNVDFVQSELLPEKILQINEDWNGLQKLIHEKGFSFFDIDDKLLLSRGRTSHRLRHADITVSFLNEISELIGMSDEEIIKYVKGTL